MIGAAVAYSPDRYKTRHSHRARIRPHRRRCPSHCTRTDRTENHSRRSHHRQRQRRSQPHPSSIGRPSIAHPMARHHHRHRIQPAYNEVSGHGDPVVGSANQAKSIGHRVDNSPVSVHHLWSMCVSLFHSCPSPSPPLYIGIVTFSNLQRSVSVEPTPYRHDTGNDDNRRGHY